MEVGPQKRGLLIQHDFVDANASQQDEKRDDTVIDLAFHSIG
jgi:hypothetical protein